LLFAHGATLRAPCSALLHAQQTLNAIKPCISDIRLEPVASKVEETFARGCRLFAPSSMLPAPSNAIDARNATNVERITQRTLLTV